MDNNTQQEEKKTTTEQVVTFVRNNHQGCKMYGLIHFILSVYALHLAFQKHCEFQWIHFLGALFFPYLYIAYFFATGGADCQLRIVNLN